MILLAARRRPFTLPPIWNRTNGFWRCTKTYLSVHVEGHTQQEIIAYEARKCEIKMALQAVNKRQDIGFDNSKAPLIRLADADA
jgi:hypothetical protein